MLASAAARRWLGAARATAIRAQQHGGSSCVWPLQSTPVRRLSAAGRLVRAGGNAKPTDKDNDGGGATAAAVKGNAESLEEKIKAAFRKADWDASGELSYHEFHALADEIGIGVENEPHECEMFEQAELGSRVSKQEFEDRLPGLRVDLLNVQHGLRRKADFPVLVVLVGDDLPGVSEAVNTLSSWMDARYVKTEVFGVPSPAELERPRFWRYWNVLPGSGEMSIYTGLWVLGVLGQRVVGDISNITLTQRLRHIERFERSLVANGGLVLKFWLHLPKKEFKKRIKAARVKGRTDGRLNETDLAVFELYDEILPLANRGMRKSNIECPEGTEWRVIESTDARHRDLTLATAIHDAIRERLDNPPQPWSVPVPPPASVPGAAAVAAAGIATKPAAKKKEARAAKGAAAAAAPAVAAPATLATPTPTAPTRQGESSERFHVQRPPGGSVLDAVRLDATMRPEDYKRQLSDLQSRLRRLSVRARDAGVSSVLVFEGWDAAGKGGVIRRMARALDVQDYTIVPIAAPSEDEKRHHHLWRFWRQLPRRGRMVIYDRSWYGRVLVERVENLCPEAAWRFAFGEINDFEDQLLEHDVALCKFWLHIDPDEQLRRFKEREKTPFKKYKITDEDFRNRKQWDAYVDAVDDMVEHTSTEAAPWHLVAAVDKRHARVQVLTTVCDTLETQLRRRARSRVWA